MKRSYLLVYNEEFGSRDVVRDAVDGIADITNWRVELPATIYLISEKSADWIASRLREKLGDKGRFVVLEVTSNKQGWLPKKSWQFFNEKPDPGS